MSTVSTGVLSVRLPMEQKTRLDALSASTGRPVAFYVREAIAEQLDALEYAYMLRSEVEASRQGRTQTWSLDEVVAELGLE